MAANICCTLKATLHYQSDCLLTNIKYHKRLTTISANCQRSLSINFCVRKVNYYENMSCTVKEKPMFCWSCSSIEMEVATASSPLAP